MTNIIPIKAIKSLNAIVGIGEFNDGDTIPNNYLENDTITINGVEISLGSSVDLEPNFYQADVENLGIVQLYDGVESTSNTLAATANSVNSVYKLIATKLDNTNGTVVGDFTVGGKIKSNTLTNNNVLVYDNGVSESSVTKTNLEKHFNADYNLIHNIPVKLDITGINTTVETFSVNERCSTDYTIYANHSDDVDVQKLLITSNTTDVFVHKYAQSNNIQLFEINAEIVDDVISTKLTITDSLLPINISMMKTIIPKQ
jgi:hypothetical protein